MESSFLKILLEAFFKEGFKKLGSFIKAHFEKNQELITKHCWQTLEMHFTEVVDWCHRLEFIGLSEAKSIPHHTIALNIAVKLRKFDTKETRIITTEEIIQNKENYVIFGDPGAGKTTTLKRIVHSFLFSDIRSDNKVPILIRLKELDTKPLMCAICDAIGIPNEARHKKFIVHVGGKEQERYTIEYYAGSQLIENAVPQILGAIRAFLILDGYDELSSILKESVKQEIIQLSRKSSNYKILLTSRHGENLNPVEGFTFCALEDLEEEQRNNIARLWADKPELFIDCIDGKPYKELQNRPLFLNFLILHFNRLDYLPDNSHEVLKQIIHLLLSDWNKFQGVKRLSQYASFYPLKKFEFLSNVAFEISFERNIKRFTHNDLISIYKKIYEEYNLDRADADNVADEIESHTGIIIQLPDNYHEFSHLVFQEYLAAEYLVKQPLSHATLKMMNIYPAIVALATCISTDSGIYFADLFLTTRHRNIVVQDSQVVAFLHRLHSEKPFFKKSVELGMALLFLYHKYKWHTQIVKLLDSLAELKNVSESVNYIRKWYYVDFNNQHQLVYTMRRNSYPVPDTDQLIDTSVELAISKWLKLYLDGGV